MALLVNSNGTAEVKEPETTTTSTSSDSGSSSNSSAGKTATSLDSTKATTATTDTSQPSKAVTTGTAADTSNSSTGTTDSTATTDTTNTAGTTISTTYTGKYDEQLADLYNQIVNRAPFTYNTADDELYQQYVDQYTQGGKKAMEDTMGQAAALTGGYGSTYAQRLGQQTYDEYMTGLTDKAEDLYQLAYQRYSDEGDKLNQQYSMLSDLAADDYSKWADQYERNATAAEVLANYGDFDLYKQMYGEDAANRMQQAYAAQVLMPLYTAGQMDAETYKEIAGVYPVGYVEPGTGGGSSSSDSPYNLALQAANYQGLSGETARTFFTNFLNTY